MHVLTGSVKLVGWRHSFVCAHSKTSDFCPVRSKPDFQKALLVLRKLILVALSGHSNTACPSLKRTATGAPEGSGMLLLRSRSTWAGMDKVSVPVRNS